MLESAILRGIEMTVYGKAFLISLVAAVAFLISVVLVSEDRHFSNRTHVKIMAVLQTTCVAAFAALVVSVVTYICRMM